MEVQFSCSCCDPSVLEVAAEHDAAIYGDLDEMAYEDLLNESIRMRDLLIAVWESTGPGSSEHQLMEAHREVSHYFEHLFRLGGEIDAA